MTFKPGAGGVGATEANVPDWEEDGNSPIDVTNTTSTTYTVAEDYDELLIRAAPGNTGFNGLQVNGDTGSNYDYVDNGDTQTSGQTQWDIPFGYGRDRLVIRDVGAVIRFSSVLAEDATGRGVAGDNDTLGGSGINQLTLLDTTGGTRSTFARVYGLDITS